jgi:hypothetical protein
MTPTLLQAVSVADQDVLLSLARAFHAEDGHPLSAAGEAALRRVAEGEPLARGWLIQEESRKVGYVVLCLGFSIEHGGRDGFIDDLFDSRTGAAEASAAACWRPSWTRPEPSAFARCIWRSSRRTARRRPSMPATASPPPAAGC